MDLMPFDAINRLESELPIYFENGVIRSKVDLDDIIEDMFGVFLLSYMRGSNLTNPDHKPTLKQIMATIDDDVAGMTWRERMKDHFAEGGTIEDVKRIIETEAHRDANTAAYEAAKAKGCTMKTWNAVMDERTRDTHAYLNGTTIPIDAEFYSFRGGSTMFPGQWGIPEEDVNCRCWLTYK